MFGHSYMQQADYPNTLVLGDSYEALSYDSGSTTPGSGGTTTGFYQQFCPYIHGKLNREGIGLGNGRIFNHAKGGVKLSDANGFAWQIAEAEDTTNAVDANVFDPVIVMFGANEVGASSGDWDTEYAAGSPTVEDWVALFQAQIDVLTGKGATNILLLNQPYFSADHPTLTGQAYRDRVDGCNRMIDELVADNDECHLVDVFTQFGGASVNEAMWGGHDGTDPQHPSIQGNKVMGDAVLEVLRTQIKK